MEQQLAQAEQDAPPAVRRTSYKRAAAAYGLTIPALKKHLVDAGWLEGHNPSARALAEGLAEQRPLADGPYGAGTQTLWDEAALTLLLGERGLAPLDERGRHFYIRHCHMLADRGRQMGEALARLLGHDLDEDDPEREWDTTPFSEIGWLIFEATEQMDAVETHDYRQQLMRRLDPLFELAEAREGVDREELEHWRAVAENACRWAERQYAK